jgi:hypothetical protein
LTMFVLATAVSSFPLFILFQNSYILGINSTWSSTFSRYSKLLSHSGNSSSRIGINSQNQPTLSVQQYISFNPSSGAVSQRVSPLSTLRSCAHQFGQLYRCWVVWGYRQGLIVIPSVFFLGSVGRIAFLATESFNVN